jgi:hypothetical protein
MWVGGGISTHPTARCTSSAVGFWNTEAHDEQIPAPKSWPQAASGNSYRRRISYSVVRSAAGRPAACAAATSSCGSRRVP